jgi:cytochrome P450
MVTVADPIPVRVVPPAAPLSTLKWLRTAVRNPLEVWPEEVYRERTFVARVLGRKALFVMDPALVEQILLREPEKYGKTEIIKRVLGPAAGTGIIVSEGTKWRKQRRIAAPSFRPDRVTAYVGEMLAAADRESERLAQLQPGSKVSLFKEMLRGNFDALSETVLSGGHHFDVPAFSAAVDTYLNSTGWVIALSVLGLPEGFPYPGRRRRMAARDHVRNVTSGLVTERRNGTPRTDLIQSLINARDEETGAVMNDTEIVDNLLSYIAAGYETTALALTWTFYLLSLYPAVEARVLGEIADAGGPDGVKPELIGEMPYMRQVINESMRLYPPVPSLIRKPNYDGSLAGFEVKQGRPIFIPIYAIHRHRLLWPDPDRFDPDRFTPDQVKARERFAYLPFGGGPRTCIGMGFATLEIAAFLSKLLPRFRFEPVGGMPIPTAQPSLRPSNGMQVIIHRRAA